MKAAPSSSGESRTFAQGEKQLIHPATARLANIDSPGVRGRQGRLPGQRGRGQANAIENRSETILLIRPRNLASVTCPLARPALAHDVARAEASLSHNDDGPIERLLARRAAWCLVDADLADREHVSSTVDGSPLPVVGSMDRRRDRAHRRLISTLKTLAEVRRSDRAVAVQVNVGDRVLGMARG